MSLYRLLLTGLLVMGVLSGSVEHGTLARFTTQVTDQQNRFSAGNVLITSTIDPTTTLTMTNLAAGDNFDAQLNIANAGSLGLTYSLATTVVTVSGSPSLASTLLLTARVKTANPCSSRDGVVLYNNELDLAAFSGRSLAPSASESICFTIVLPTSAGSFLQNTNLAATFKFQAVQQ
jgi:hypothetical protein